MTFSKTVKRELCEIRESSRLNKRILLSGLIYGMRESRRGFLVPLEKRHTVVLLKRLISGDRYEIGDKHMIISADFFEDVEGYIRYAEDDRSSGLFLRGVFISAGVISNPGVEYHLEITPPNEGRGEFLYSLINERGISVKRTLRKKQPVIYIKESDMISDFLAYIGGVHSAMEIINAKIYKEVRNNVNRSVNCETANIGKTVLAAGRQIEDIELIFSVKGENYLSEDLLTVARIRLENVEMSLKEIGEVCSPVLSRSGVNHRLSRIRQIADSIREEASDKKDE